MIPRVNVHSDIPTVRRAPAAGGLRDCAADRGWPPRPSPETGEQALTRTRGPFLTILAHGIRRQPHRHRRGPRCSRAPPRRAGRDHRAVDQAGGAAPIAAATAPDLITGAVELAPGTRGQSFDLGGLVRVKRYRAGYFQPAQVIVRGQGGGQPRPRLGRSARRGREHHRPPARPPAVNWPSSTAPATTCRPRLPARPLRWPCPSSPGRWPVPRAGLHPGGGHRGLGPRSPTRSASRRSAWACSPNVSGSTCWCLQARRQPGRPRPPDSDPGLDRVRRCHPRHNPGPGRPGRPHRPRASHADARSRSTPAGTRRPTPPSRAGPDDPAHRSDRPGDGLRGGHAARVNCSTPARRPHALRMLRGTIEDRSTTF